MNRNGTNSRENGTEINQSGTKSNVNGTNSRKSEHLTDREWAELMGVNRDTYRRGPGGAIRRR